MFTLDWLLEVKTNPRHPLHKDPKSALMCQMISEKCQDFIQGKRDRSDDDDSSGVNSASADKKQKPDTETGDTGKQPPKASEGPNKELDFHLVIFLLSHPHPFIF